MASEQGFEQNLEIQAQRIDQLEIAVNQLREGYDVLIEGQEEIKKLLEGFFKKMEGSLNSKMDEIGLLIEGKNPTPPIYVEVVAGLGAIISGNQFLEPDGLFPNHIPNPEDKEAMEDITRAVLENKADLGNIFYTEVDRSVANVIDEAICLNCVGEKSHVAIDKHMFDEMPKRKIKEMLEVETVNITLENMYVFEGKESRAIEIHCDAFDEVLENKLGKNVLEFDRDRKSMSVIVKSSTGNNSLLVKGAVETLLERSSFVQLFPGSVVELDESSRKAILESLHQMSTSALKVLGSADKDDLPDFATYYGDEDHPAHQFLLNPANYSSIESKLVFVGLASLRDLPWREVPQATEDCRTPGIQVMVITGDNKNTAEAICYDIGVFDGHGNISSRSLTDCNNQIAKGSKIKVAENSQKSCKNKNARCFTEGLHFSYCKSAHSLTAFKFDPGGSDVKDISVKLNVGASWLYRDIFATKSPSFKITFVDDLELRVSSLGFPKSWLFSVKSEIMFSRLYRRSQQTSCKEIDQMVKILLRENIFKFASSVYVETNEMHWIVGEAVDHFLLNKFGWRKTDSKVLNIRLDEHAPKVAVPEEIGIFLLSCTKVGSKHVYEGGNFKVKVRKLVLCIDEAQADYIASLCDNTNLDNRYVPEILLASSPLPRDLKDFQFHSSSHPINPESFMILEQTKAIFGVLLVHVLKEVISIELL